MTLPLVIGIGVTNGIHILNRFAEEQHAGHSCRAAPARPCSFPGLTAIAGFGSLILAKHQGIHSLGEVMSMGVATCMIAALDIFAGGVESVRSLAKPPIKTTQCRQCTIDTGSGGTEVKTSSN